MQIPFYPNDKTNMHCFQASVQMILGYFMPERTFTLDELVKLSGSVEGMSTWPARMLIELDKMGLDIVMVEGFDGKDFIERGPEYLREVYAGETAEWQIENGDIDKERADYQELYDHGISVQQRIPTIGDIQKYMSDGYLVKVTLNSRRLKGLDGYLGHSVIVVSVDDESVILHNPGLPPTPNQKVTRKIFEAAWAYPNEGAKELIAMRLK